MSTSKSRGVILKVSSIACFVQGWKQAIIRLSANRAVPTPLMLLTKRRPVCSLSGSELNVADVETLLAEAIIASAGTISLACRSVGEEAAAWVGAESVG